MIYTKTFDCGMRFAFRRTRSQVAYTALAIQSGTRNEPEALSGIAHMAEHMLFILRTKDKTFWVSLSTSVIFMPLETTR